MESNISGTNSLSKNYKKCNIDVRSPERVNNQANLEANRASKMVKNNAGTKGPRNHHTNISKMNRSSLQNPK